MQGAAYELLKTIELPGKPLARFDIAWAEESRRRCYIADRSNARIVVIDTDRDEYIGALGEGLLAGVGSTSSMSGPNGVLVLGDCGELWTGDGDSTVKIFEVDSGELIDTITTEGTMRVDELAYDGTDHLILAANDKDVPPFASLISTERPHEIVAKIPFPQATNGLHQPVWDSGVGRFTSPSQRLIMTPRGARSPSSTPTWGRWSPPMPFRIANRLGLRWVRAATSVWRAVETRSKRDSSRDL